MGSDARFVECMATFEHPGLFGFRILSSGRSNRHQCIQAYRTVRLDGDERCIAGVADPFDAPIVRSTTEPQDTVELTTRRNLVEDSLVAHAIVESDSQVAIEHAHAGRVPLAKHFEPPVESRHDVVLEILPKQLVLKREGDDLSRQRTKSHGADVWRWGE